MSRPFHGGNLTEAATKYEVDKDRIVDFSANINPLGLSGRVREALLSSIDAALHYPEPYCEGLKEEVAAYLGVDDNNIIIGNGSCDLIYMIPRVLTPHGVLIPVPTFSEYEYAVKINKARCRFLLLEETNGFSLKPESILDDLEDVDMTFICNPHNPTGTVMMKEDLLFVVSQCEKRGVKVVVDEAFIDFVEDHDSLTLVREAVLRENLLVLRSLTKFFGVPGLRVGYLVGGKLLVEKISAMQPPWMVNVMGRIAAKEALDDQVYIEETRRYVVQERDYLFSELKRMKGIEPYPSGANFIFCRLEADGLNSTQLAEKLGGKGILVRDCATFRGLDSRFIRVAVRRREENIRLVSALLSENL